MSIQKLFLFVSVVLIAVYILFVFSQKKPKQIPQNATETTPNPAPALVITNDTPTNTQPIAINKLKHRLAEYTPDQKSKFQENFNQRYRPAIAKWFKAFDGHIPFDVEAVTLDKFVESIGRNEAYNEYIFVVNGVTLGVRDKRGIAEVDYLNSPQQTRKLAMLPNGSQAPSLKTPVTKDEIIQMLEAESGTRFQPNEVRIHPSGISGSLNGGALVDVGGNPENGGSWKYDMVFDPEGKLGYYLKGQ
jgi:hypothetical protein